MSDLLVRGPLWGGQGSNTPGTAGPSGAKRIQVAHAEYSDAAIGRRIFSIDSDSVTIAAAHATKGALATAKFINGFFNPPTSGKNAVILNAIVATVSGTPAGPYFYNYLQGVTPTNAATGTIRNAYLGGAGSEMIAETGVVLTVVGGATTALIQQGVLGGPAAIAAGAGNYSIADAVRGAIIVPPGTLFGITALGAGTSHVVQSTLTWEEVLAL